MTDGDHVIIRECIFVSDTIAAMFAARISRTHARRAAARAASGVVDAKV